jgi:hypothetical protein
MNYVLFNNYIHVSDGIKIERFQKGSHLGHIFDQMNEVHICMVEFDVLIASASESAWDKKDSILALKFDEYYKGEYVLQDEKIGNNIFQVIGIKSEKVKEVYSLIPSEKVVTFVPYAVAVRNYILRNKILDNKLVVFLDDIGHEKFITVFEGMKFSRTRTVFNEKAEQLLPEIKRSAINFEKKMEYQGAEGFIIVTNNKNLCREFKEIEHNLIIEAIDSAFPALDGLMRGGFGLKYILPEEIIKKRRQEELKKWRQCLLISVAILAIGIFFYFYYQINLQFSKNSFSHQRYRNKRLEIILNQLDPLVYHSIINHQKRINYALAYLNITKTQPAGYITYSFGFYDQGNHWVMEEYLYIPDDGPYDNIPAQGALQKASIRDYLINSKPGKFLRIEL